MKPVNEEILNGQEYNQHLEVARKLLFDYLPLDDTQWDVFKQGFKIRKYNKGEYVLNEGETERYLSIVIQGLTRHFVLVKGEEMSFDFSFQHEFNCSYSSFIQQSPSMFFIEALEDCILASLPYTFLQHLYEQFPESNKFGRTAQQKAFIHYWLRTGEIDL